MTAPVETVCPDRAADAASEADRAFFLLHPHRTYRVRAFIPGEMPRGPASLPGEGFVLVRQVRPGKRYRLPIATNVRIPDEEQIVRDVFNHLAPLSAKEGHSSC